MSTVNIQVFCRIRNRPLSGDQEQMLTDIARYDRNAPVGVFIYKESYSVLLARRIAEMLRCDVLTTGEARARIFRAFDRARHAPLPQEKWTYLRPEE